MRASFAWCSLFIPTFATFIACGGSVENGPPPSPEAGLGDDTGIPDSGVADTSAVDAHDADASAACYDDSDCTNSYCLYSPGDGTAHCPGRCVPFVPRGGFCLSFDKCADGLTCDPEGHTCGDPRPAPAHVGAGEHCSFLGPLCHDGLYCSGVFPDNGICAPLVPEGGACNPRYAGSCADNRLCVGWGDGDVGRCQAAAALGESCLVKVAGAEGHSGCGNDAVCSQGKCTSPPSSGPCATELPFCSTSTFCDDTTNTCQPRKTNGEGCQTFLECASGVCDLLGHCGTALCPRPQ